MNDGTPEGSPPAASGLADLLKSMFGFTWAMSVFGVHSLANLLQPERAAAALDAVTQATERQLAGGPPNGGPGQRGGGASDGALPPSGGAARPAPVPPAPAGPVDSGALDTDTFVALGEGLAAGAADFFLSADLQRDCF